jgi:tripartite-type tricarboxylate transporter receptor subunit TctC
MQRRDFLAGVAGLAGFGLSRPATAQSEPWPTRPIRLVVGFAAGGATDIVGRLLTPGLGERLGQSVYVENRAGAGGNLAAASVAQAEPDGYTLMLATPGPETINPTIYDRLPFDPQKDFAPIALLCSILDVLAVPADRPWKNVKELIDDARARPGAITFSSSGIGSPSHVALLLLQALTGINVVHVPYRGGGPMMGDFLAGRIDATIGTGPVLMPLGESGRLRILGVATAKRSPLAPNLPAISEAVPGYEMVNWIGLSAPARTPPVLLARIHQAAIATLDDPVLRSKLTQQAAVPTPLGPEEYRAHIKAEHARWTPLLQAAKAKAE